MGSRTQNRTHQRPGGWRGDEGFTLIELLIVMLVLSILAGIAILAIRPFQDRAELACGRANAKIERVVDAAVEAGIGTEAELYDEAPECDPVSGGGGSGNAYVSAANSIGGVQAQVATSAGNVTLNGGATFTTSGGPTSALPGFLHHDAASSSYSVLNSSTGILNGATSGTIAYWRRNNGPFVGTLNADFAKGNDTYQGRRNDATTLSVELRTTGQGSGGTQTNGTVGSSWQFVVVTWNGTNQALYIDNMATAAATTARTAAVGTNTNPVTLGAWMNTGSTTADRFSNVDIAGFTLFDKALNATERASLKDA